MACWSSWDQALGEFIELRTLSILWRANQMQGGPVAIVQRWGTRPGMLWPACMSLHWRAGCDM